MQALSEKIVVLGTGGTIAGMGTSGSNDRYVAGQIGIEHIIGSLNGGSVERFGQRLEWEQVSQADSKDMSWELLCQLGRRCEEWLARVDVKGIVITHGTDTMEETAYLLHRTLPWQRYSKPVVLTGAMRPATADHPDGPANLAQALCLADSAGQDSTHAGVWVSFAGDVYHALYAQKTDPSGLHAFSSHGQPACARVDAQHVHWREGLDTQTWQLPNAHQPIHHVWHRTSLPRVEIIHSHSCVSGQMVLDLLQSTGEPVRGMVVAGTGNGTIAHNLETALAQAVSKGVRVVRATRCAQGRVLTDLSSRFDALPDLDAHALTPAKARWALILALMEQIPRS